MKVLDAVRIIRRLPTIVTGLAVMISELQGKMIELETHRLPALESVTYQGNHVHRIPVPVGWSPEQAWEAFKRGDDIEEDTEFKMVTVLSDSHSCLMRVYP